MSATGCVVTQEVGFDNLCEMIDGRPCGIDTLINHHARNGFSLDRARVERIIQAVLSSQRTLVQTKWRKHETVRLMTTTLLDTLDSDEPIYTPQ